MEIESPLLFNSPLLSFALMFSAIYCFGYFVLFKNWGSSRYEASSCLISSFHGTPAVILAIFSLIKSQNNLFPLDFPAQNTSFHNLVLEFSMGYFIIDLLHYIIFFPKDFLFMAHHLATLYVLATARYIVHHGAVSILGLLVLAEITSPFQNTWTLAGFRKVDLPEAARFYEFLSPYFFIFYSVVRGILGPLYVIKMGAAFASGEADGLIPRWAWISWMVVIVAAIWVSILWVLNLWIGFCKTRANLLKKVS
ncbi:hypothetical protein ACH5RR_030810 [Cinchona calisaya]|uniref:TLC domain-containing protein n=1 Tax=Cinchona calisaya TaxID=153742 RepID=A0ABD2YVR3_9GENT